MLFYQNIWFGLQVILRIARESFVTKMGDFLLCKRSPCETCQWEVPNCLLTELFLPQKCSGLNIRDIWASEAWFVRTKNGHFWAACSISVQSVISAVQTVQFHVKGFRNCVQRAADTGIKRGYRSRQVNTICKRGFKNTVLSSGGTVFLRVVSECGEWGAIAVAIVFCQYRRRRLRRESFCYVRSLL